MSMDIIKTTAKALLFTDIRSTEFSPLIVQHPFTSSGFVCIMANGKSELLNVLDDDDNLERWQGYISSFIDRAKSVRNIFYMVNKPYRLTFLSMIMDELPADELGLYLTTAYIEDEFPSQNIDQKSLMKMFCRASRESLMTEEELAHLNAMPESVRIYRGVQSRNKKYASGVSWTTDPDIAKWFATRFDSDGVVYEADISKEHVLAYYDARSEHEIVCEPGYLKNLRLMEA